LDGTFLVPDRVEVQQRLRRMLPRAVPGIDHGPLGELRREARRSLLGVAQDDSVAVRFDHPDRVGEGLPLLDRGPFRAAETQDPPAEPRHRALEGEARPRRGFIKQRREDLPVQGLGPTAARGDGHHLLRGLQDEFDVRPRQVANREDVASLEAGHHVPYSEVQLKGYPRGRPRAGTALGLRASPRSRLGNLASPPINRHPRGGSMSPKKDTQKSAKSTAATNKKFKGFTDEERAAMKEYVQEMKASAQRGPRPEKADGESALLTKIAEMQEP